MYARRSRSTLLKLLCKTFLFRLSAEWSPDTSALVGLMTVSCYELSPIYSTTTQLNSTRRRVELSWVELWVESLWTPLRRPVELRWVASLWSMDTLYDARRPSLSVGGSENFRTPRRNWPSWPTYSRSVLSRSCCLFVYFAMKLLSVVIKKGKKASPCECFWNWAKTLWTQNERNWKFSSARLIKIVFLKMLFRNAVNFGNQISLYNNLIIITTEVPESN